MENKKGYGVIVFMLIALAILVYAWVDGEHNNDVREQEMTGDIQNTIYENAWIVKMQDGNLLLYKDGELFDFEVSSDELLEEVLADVTIENGKVKKIKLKTDVICGKVLRVYDDGVELEGYGKVLFDENLSVLKNYGELENAQLKDVLVGYALQSFIVGDGKICGIVMESEPTIDNIRVLITTEGYDDMYHEKIVIGSDGDYIVSYGEIEKKYKAGETVVIDKNSFLGSDRIFVTAQDEDDMLQLNSIARNYGMPTYRGIFEIIDCSEGLVLINELSLEEYLYSVLPSEMPESYGLEALKAQAVCARSYAYRQILNNSLHEYGAHVDDSLKYQVYNNMPETELAIEAVNQTKGQILTYEGDVVEAFYFSTSCGHTTDADIWSGRDVPYVRGKLLNEGNAKLILDTEDEFEAFIKNHEFESYDMDFAWYRWEVEFSISDLTGLVKSARLDEEVGSVISVEVLERGTGGIVKRLKINGTAGNVIIDGEYTIRKLLNPNGYAIKRMDGTVVSNFSLLPSAYFIAEPVVSDEKIEGYYFYGGGFGHGAGMSQNGAKSMTDEGIKYDEVLTYFFEDIKIENCYFYQ